MPVEELAAGKLRALLARGAPRDLDDVIRLPTRLGEASLTSPRAIDDAMVERVNDRAPFAHVSRAEPQALVLSMPMRLDGGVTVSWRANAFQHWVAARRAPERLLKSPRTAQAMKAKPRRSAGPTVH